MSERRETGSDCPIPPTPTVSMSLCQPCPYFRGAAYATGRTGWTIHCNWPRNGSSTWQPLARPLDDLPADEIARLVRR